MTGAETPRVIALWSPPRARSTAFTRMMIERGDVEVVHEPLSNLLAVGHFDVGDRRATTPAELVEALLELGERRPVFFKDTTEYRYAPYLDETAARSIVHTFLIREPAEVVASHHAINPQLTLEEVGFEWLAELYDLVARLRGERPPVFHADDLVADPGALVERYCEAVGLPFVPEALAWQPQPQDRWRRTAHWHRDVDASAGFHARRNEYAVTPETDARLAAYCEHHRPFYERLSALAIRPGAGAGAR